MHLLQVDPNVDIVKAAWSPFEETKWIKPLLVELSGWRERFKIISEPVLHDKDTNITFLANLSGLPLHSHVPRHIHAKIMVLQGKIIIEPDFGENITLATNEAHHLANNANHTIHTVSDGPAGFMYVTYNTLNMGKSKRSS